MDRSKTHVTNSNGTGARWLRFLRWFCPQSLYEGIEGDLVERFKEDCKEVGEKAARRRFAWNVIRFFRPGIILRNKFGLKINRTTMIGNYLNVASRNIKKRKLYSFINAFGLSVGIAFCMLIYLFVEDERSFDQFHVNRERIYRLEHTAYQFWNTQVEEVDRYRRSTAMPLGFREALVDELSQVEYATRFKECSLNIRHGDIFMREDVVWVDPDIALQYASRERWLSIMGLATGFAILISCLGLFGLAGGPLSSEVHTPLALPYDRSVLPQAQPNKILSVCSVASVAPW